ncbi:MAG: SIS domain-containing protein [Oscillospiraceae bacterium]|nr:SIS domain-containing protein [Oscillospiraceae bacterium]
MTYTQKYFAHIEALLKRVLEVNEKNIRKAAEMLVETNLAGGKIFYFGCSHAGIMAEEAFYRTGGLVIANPILAKGLTLDVVPVTDTSILERKPEYAHEILSNTDINRGDLLFIHSVSGRNGVSVEMAIEAEKRGIKTICVTSVEYSSASTSRHPCGKRLFEVSDLLLDNCGCIGDAAIDIEGFMGKTAPTSTIAVAAIINSITAESVGLFVEKGLEPPVFMSANLDGGDEYNAKMMEKYKDKITYI